VRYYGENGHWYVYFLLVHQIFQPQICKIIYTRHYSMYLPSSSNTIVCPHDTAPGCPVRVSIICTFGRKNFGVLHVCTLKSRSVCRAKQVRSAKKMNSKSTFGPVFKEFWTTLVWVKNNLEVSLFSLLFSFFLFFFLLWIPTLLGGKP